MLLWTHILLIFYSPISFYKVLYLFQVAAISDCFIPQAWWPWAKHRWGLTVAYTTQETPRPAHPVDSYRPQWSTTTLPLHSWASTEGRGWSVITVSPWSCLAWVNPSHWSSSSNQGLTTRGGCTHTKGAPQVAAWVVGRLCQWTL